MRKVLFVANASKIGGGNKVLIDLVEHLDPNRYTAAIVAPQPGPLVDWALTRQVPVEISAAHDWEGRAGLGRRTVELIRIVARHQPAILHAVGPMAYRAVGLAGFLARRIRVCHLGFPPEPGELERAFVSGPEAVIGCYVQQATDHEAEIKRINPRAHVVGIPNGVDVDRFSPGPAAPDVQELRRGYALAIGILGHVSDVKGYGTFIEAAAQLVGRRRDCLFLAVGGETTQPGARARFEARVQELGIGDRFRFLGARSDVAAVLRALDLVCLPSLAEGFPLALLEAMATGKPVVATPVGGVREALDENVTGLLIPPNDPHALAGTLETLMDSDERRAAMGAAGRARSEQHFSVRSFAAAVQQEYDELVLQRQKRPARLAAAL